MFGAFGSYFRFKKSVIDNTTFRLHYRTTFAFLVLASLLTTANQFIGAPIQCIVDGIPGGIMNTYCWIHGTFTVPRQLTGRVGTDIPHPGVGPLAPPPGGDAAADASANPEDINLVDVTEDGEEIRHAWYQWVCFVLFLQAVLCYTPHYLWKSWEGGKLGLIIQGLDETYIEKPKNTDDRKRLLVNYLSRNVKRHNLYTFKFVFCEVLNLVNVIVQIYFMDLFLGGQFTRYGTDVLAISELPLEDRVDPLSKVFPKVTKCTFHKYGPSGTVENKDGLCVLANNIINEKIYIFLWFWFITITVWTSIHLLVRVVSVSSRYSRYLLLCHRAKSSAKEDISYIVRKCDYGDWFILMQLAKHVNPIVFHDVILDFKDELDQKKLDNSDH